MALTLITFADFASRLRIGDTLFVYDSTYKGSELRYNRYPMQETRRFSRVRRIGKTQIQLMDVHGNHHVVESTNFISVIRQGHRCYNIETPRGAVVVEHQPWKMPATSDEDVFRWVHARWGLMACHVTTKDTWDPKVTCVPLVGGLHVYGRSEKELRYKFDQAQLAAAAAPAAVQPNATPPAADVVSVEVRAVALMLRGAQHQTISIPLPRDIGGTTAWCEHVNPLLDQGARLTGFAYTTLPTTKEK